MGVYYFARCDSKKEYVTPGGLDLGQKSHEILHNDFRGVLFSLLAAGYFGSDPVLGRWCGEAVAIGNDTCGGADTLDLDDAGYTDISPLVKEWLDAHRDDELWFDHPEDNEPISAARFGTDLTLMKWLEKLAEERGRDGAHEDAVNLYRCAEWLEKADAAGVTCPKFDALKMIGEASPLFWERKINLVVPAGTACVVCAKPATRYKPVPPRGDLVPSCDACTPAF